MGAIKYVAIILETCTTHSPPNCLIVFVSTSYFLSARGGFGGDLSLRW